jgi:hypothetical protein
MGRKMDRNNIPLEDDVCILYNLLEVKPCEAGCGRSSDKPGQGIFILRIHRLS